VSCSDTGKRWYRFCTYIRPPLPFCVAPPPREQNPSSISFLREVRNGPEIAIHVRFRPTCWRPTEHGDESVKEGAVGLPRGRQNRRKSPRGAGLGRPPKAPEGPMTTETPARGRRGRRGAFIFAVGHLVSSGPKVQPGSSFTGSAEVAGAGIWAVPFHATRSPISAEFSRRTLPMRSAFQWTQVARRGLGFP
jgi:hypothetical protein